MLIQINILQKTCKMLSLYNGGIIIIKISNARETVLSKLLGFRYQVLDRNVPLQQSHKN